MTVHITVNYARINVNNGATDTINITMTFSLKIMK